MMRGQVGDVADGPNRRHQRLDRQERRSPLLDRLFNLEAGDRIGLRDVRADEQKHIGGDDVLERDGPAMGPLHPAERPDPVDVSVAGAAVDSIGTDSQPHEFLEDVQVFIRAA